jgi:hypothetical protein
MRISGFILEVILEPKSMKSEVEFRCVFGMLFGGGWELFWNYFGRLLGAKTVGKRKREDLRKYLFPLTNIYGFRGYGVYLGCQQERKIE